MVSASSGWGNLAANVGISNAKNSCMKQAANKGATHIVWTSVQGGYSPFVSGNAYRCLSSSQDAAIAPRPEEDMAPDPRNSSHFDRHNKMVVKDLVPQMGINKQMAMALSEVIKNTLAEYCSVQSLDALAALSQVVEEKLKAGCDDTSCIIEVAGAMDIAQVVTGNISKLGDTYMISLMLIQTKGENLGVVKRASEECTCTEAELIGMTRRAALKLIGAGR